MPNFNQCIFIGHLCRDPEMRYTTDNTPFTRSSIAVNHTWKNKSNEKQEEVMFLDFVAFGKTAEVINQYFTKGKPIMLIGRLKLDKWQDKDGNNRQKHELMVERFTFVGGDQQGGDNRQQGQRQEQRQPQGAGTRQPMEEEDIPF